jgi:hypothetical protein
MADEIPLGEAGGPFEATEGITDYISFAFPTPPISWGVMSDSASETVIEGIEMYFPNALHPPGEYLEPTIGQIWPRIG